jgi:serine O-acetyltransferase
VIDLFKYLKFIKEKDPAMKSYLQILLFNDGFWAILWYKIAHYFYTHHMKVIGLYIMHRVKIKRGIEIHPACIIGKNLLIDHGVGVVIGETAIIGDNCVIYQGVTLGGTGKEKGKRHPTIGNYVMIGAGAKILGNIYIGDNVKIGANAVVLNNIEPLNTVVGCKGKIVNRI